MSLSGRRFLLGTGLSFAAIAALSVAMVPVRGHLSVATTALVLVVPVVVGVVVGGFVAGVLSVVAGFLVYDVLFIPPYGTLVVGASQNWVALGVYAAVMLLVARVVSALSAARAEARRQEVHIRRLFELSETLAQESGRAELEERIVSAVRDGFDMTSVALLLAVGERLEPVAFAGEPWNAEDLDRLVPRRGVPVRATVQGGGVRAIALSTTGTPVGLIGMKGRPLDQEERELLRFFAGQAALSLERARLREQAVRSEVLEETERLQKSLMSAVSHDLRTPLSTIKLAATALDAGTTTIDEDDRAELVRTIDMETDRLDRLVTNLLDVTRVQAGALAVAAQPVAVADLVSQAVSSLKPLLEGRTVKVTLPEELPLVSADHVLVGQVLVNLLENAARHSPPGTSVRVRAEREASGDVVVTVEDEGPGLPRTGEDVFALFGATGPGKGTGVGLFIAKAFVEAHGQRLWAEQTSSGGARLRFALPSVVDHEALA